MRGDFHGDRAHAAVHELAQQFLQLDGARRGESTPAGHRDAVTAHEHAEGADRGGRMLGGIEEMPQQSNRGGLAVGTGHPHQREFARRPPMKGGGRHRSGTASVTYHDGRKAGGHRRRRVFHQRERRIVVGVGKPRDDGNRITKMI